VRQRLLDEDLKVNRLPLDYVTKATAIITQKHGCITSFALNQHWMP